MPRVANTAGRTLLHSNPGEAAGGEHPHPRHVGESLPGEGLGHEVQEINRDLVPPGIKPEGYGGAVGGETSLGGAVLEQ